MKNRRFLQAMAVIAAAVVLASASYWEGTAVSSGYGEFPSAGLYGACSSFPRNSLVDVTNLENGKTVRVIITKGVDNPGVFMSLSPEAAEALGIPLGMVARVRATIPQDVVDSLVRSDTPGLSQDPDLNPEALVSRARARSGVSPSPGQVAAATSEPPRATPSPLALATPSPSGFEELALAESPRPAPSLRPQASQLPTATAGARTAIVDESLRLQPTRDAGVSPELARLPPPLAEQAPSSVDARATDGSISDLSLDRSGASSRTPDSRSARPEADTRLSLSTPLKGSAGYGLSEPGLEPLPPQATVYELARTSGGQDGLGPVALSSPTVAGRERPEVASGRLEGPAPEPSALALARSLPVASLPDTAEAASISFGEGPEALSPSRPGIRTGSGLEVGLATPSFEEASPSTATVFERPSVSGRSMASSSAALAEPGFLLEAGEKAIVDERLAASRRRVSMDLALSEPKVEEAAVEKAEVDVRLAAAKASRPEAAFALSDPESTAVKVVEADDRPPEAISMLRDSPKAASTASSLALAAPSLPAADAMDERMLASAGPEIATDGLRPKDASGLPAVAMVEPSIDATDLSARDLLTRTAESSTAVPPTGALAAAESGTAPALGKLESLTPGEYYVQIGVYRNGEMAMQASKKLAESYPLFYQEIISLDRPLYRVFIGPLRKDESGLVLYQVKAKGYRDAFIRPGL